MSTGRVARRPRPIPPRLDRRDAGKKLAGGWLRARSTRNASIECLWLPIYPVAVELSNDRGASPTVWFGLDGIDGTLERLDRSFVAELDLPRAADSCGGDERDVVLPFGIDPGEAPSRAESAVPWAVAALGARRRGGLDVRAIRAGAAVGYPYWVRFVRRRDRWKLFAVDGMNGAKVGALGRARLARGLVLLHQLHAPQRESADAATQARGAGPLFNA